MKVAQISILTKIAGNVNADEVIGQRITLKKFYTSEGGIRPFVSARAIKYAIRQCLRDEYGFNIDPFQPVERRLLDTGDPIKYVDNDIFGFMAAEKRDELARRRQAPIALSYLRALRDTAIKAEFALRAPRPGGTEGNPLPFEVEVAEWIGRIDCLIYDYIGKWQGTEREGVVAGQEFIPKNERKKRLEAFLKVFMTPKFVLARRTNSLVIPEHLVALVALSEKGPWPIYQYLDYETKDGKFQINVEKLEKLNNRKFTICKMNLIDYAKSVPEKCPISTLPAEKLPELVRDIVTFIVS
jgi:CRISPR-associated protein Cst2